MNGWLLESEKMNLSQIMKIGIMKKRRLKPWREEEIYHILEGLIQYLRMVLEQDQGLGAGQDLDLVRGLVIERRGC